MIYKTAYQTTLGSVFETKNIVTALQQSIIRDGVFPRTLDIKADGPFVPLFITGGIPSEIEIPLFTHPISIFHVDKKQYLCCDLRYYVNKGFNFDEASKYIKNGTEFNFAKTRLIMNLVWLNEGPSELKNNFRFAGIIYAMWISQLLTKAFALDYKDQTVISIIAHVFYQFLFEENIEEITEEDIQRLSVHTIKATSADSKMVFEYLDKIRNFGPINNIDSLCFLIKELTDNVRLDHLNTAYLLTLMKSSWFGTNAKEIITVALEHPPTWCALIYTSLVERTYKNTMIATICERFGKRGKADEFVMNYKTLAGSYINKESSEVKILEYV